MKNNGKSRTFKRSWRGETSVGSSASRSELAPHLCQRISLGSINDWKGSSFSQVQQLIAAQDSTRSIATSGRSRPGQDWQEWPRDQFEIPLCHQAALCPRVTLCSILPGCLSRKRGRTDVKDFLPRPSTPQTLTPM